MGLRFIVKGLQRKCLASSHLRRTPKNLSNRKALHIFSHCLTRATTTAIKSKVVVICGILLLTKPRGILTHLVAEKNSAKTKKHQTCSKFLYRTVRHTENFKLKKERWLNRTLREMRHIARHLQWISNSNSIIKLPRITIQHINWCHRECRAPRK